MKTWKLATKLVGTFFRECSELMSIFSTLVHPLRAERPTSSILGGNRMEVRPVQPLMKPPGNVLRDSSELMPIWAMPMYPLRTSSVSSSRLGGNCMEVRLVQPFMKPDGNLLTATSERHVNFSEIDACIEKGVSQ